MGEFRQYLQEFRPSSHQPVSETDMDISMEMTKQSSELNSTLLENFSIADFSLETLILAHQVPDFPAICAHDSLYSTDQLAGGLTATPTTRAVAVDEDIFSKKRKAMEQQSNNNYQSISPAVSTTTELGGSGNTNTMKKNKLSKRKKGKSKEKEAEEVIHVRARRGQATDSHSLAERVRREKINEKMRCLQDLVPGCHKTMGMAVMLDEIINYVHSLQNQVEFLSMELAAASSSYDLNLQTESIKRAQGTNSHVAVQMEKWARDRYEEQNSFHFTWPL